MIKTALVGLGAIYEIHKNAILSIPYAQITAVCDIDLERANSQAAKLSCNSYTNYDEMLEKEKPDVVHICTPHYLHTQMACKALKHDAFVFLEKPVGLYYEEALEVKKAQEESGKVVCVSLQNRYNETSKKILEIIQSGTLGKLVGIRSVLTWRRTNEYYTQSDWRGKLHLEGGALLMNQAIHTLDLMNLFADSKPSLVEASIANRANKGIINEEDTAEVFIEYENGVRGIFFGTNAFTQNMPHSIELNFEKGELSLYRDSLYMYTNCETKCLCSDDIMRGEKSYWGLGHRFLIHDFYEFIQNGTGGYVDIDAGLSALKLCDMIYSAANKDKN